MKNLKFMAFSLLFLSQFGSTQVLSPWQRAQVIVEQLKAPLKDCPARIWKNIDKQYGPTILYSAKEQLAFVWNHPEINNGELGPYDFHKIPLLLREGFMNFGDFENRYSGSFSLDDTADIPPNPFINDLTSIFVVHEGFHFFVQQKTWSHLRSSERGLEYPIAWEPRYYRYQLIKNLYLAFMNPDLASEKLAQAKYWDSLFKQSYPQYRDRYYHYDRTEGSAQYVDLLSQAMAHFGCGVSDERLLSSIAENLEVMERVSDIGRQVFGDSSYYTLGVLSGMLSKRMGLGDFQSRIESGDTPVDFLLSSVLSKPEVDDQTLKDEIQKIAQETQAQVNPMIMPYLNQLQDKDSVRIVIPSSWMVGFFSSNSKLPAPFILPQKWPEWRIIVLAVVLARSPDQKIYFKTDGLTLGMQTDQTPCKGGGLVVTLNPSDLQRNESELRVRTQALELVGPASSFENRIDNQGLNWLCVLDPSRN